MRGGCGCLLSLLIVLPLMFVFILLAGINTWVLDRGFYEEVLSEPAFYQSMIDESVINWGDTDLSDEFGAVPSAALNAGLRELITPEYLQSVTTSTVDQVFDVLEGRTDRFNFAFDLTPLKASLAGTGGANFANAYANALPTCGANQDALPPNSVLPICREPNVSQTALIAQVQAALPALAQSIPNEIVVDRPMEQAQIQGLPIPLNNVGQLTTVVVVVFGVVAVLFWLIAASMLGRDTRSRFLWLGFLLLIPAGLVLLAGVTMNTPAVEVLIRDSLLRGDRVQDVGLATSVAQTALNATGHVRTGFVIAGGIPTLVAVLLLIIGLAIRPGDKRKREGRTVQVPTQY